IWDLSDGTHARAGGRIAVPMAPFPGVMGTALDVAGGHSTMPPRKNGGNMDIKQLTGGSTLSLPVWVDGALFSVGDTHAIQGDGEVCVTAVEMSGRVTARFGLERGRGLAERQLRTRPAPPPAAAARARPRRDVVRHHRARARSLRGVPASGPLHDRSPSARAGALSGGGPHPLQRPGGPQYQRAP